jgi:Type VI secretion system/phage-baseplate injector OB domain
MSEDKDRYWGKYAAYVRDTEDEEGRGRLRLFVPEVFGDDDDADHWSDWALPCLPWVAEHGVSALIPEKNGQFGVWVEFRQGDPRFPVWVGVFPWSSVDYDKIAVQSDDIRLSGPAAAQRAIRGGVYRSAEDQLLTALDLFVTALNAFGGTCVTLPPTAPAGALSAAATAMKAAITTFKSNGSSYLSTKVSLD